MNSQHCKVEKYRRGEEAFGDVLGNQNSATSIATQVLLAFHMLFVNILLINLLIAMFRSD